MLRQRSRYSFLAIWGFRFAIFSAHVIVFTVLLHRYASQPTAVALNLLQIGFFVAAVGLVFSLIAALVIMAILHLVLSRTAFGYAQAGDDFIENEYDAVLRAQLAQGLQKRLVCGDESRC